MLLMNSSIVTIGCCNTLQEMLWEGKGCKNPFCWRGRDRTPSGDEASLRPRQLQARPGHDTPTDVE